MLFHDDEIKKKLLEVEIETLRKHEFDDAIMIHKKSNYKHKKSPYFDLSEWKTNEKTTTYTSFPLIQYNSEKITKNDPIESISNYVSNYLTKPNFKSKFKTSMPNPINLSFNPEQKKIYHVRHKRPSNLAQKEKLRSEEKKTKIQLEKFLINGQIKIKLNQKKSSQNNSQTRGSHLLRLLRQRDILRRKRYSFDIDAGFMTKSYFNQ